MDTADTADNADTADPANDADTADTADPADDADPADTADTAEVRRATIDDADALVELRAQMFDSIGDDIGPPAAPWRQRSADWFRLRLAEPDRFAAFVVDVPGSGVVATAAGICDDHAPGPGRPSGWVGHIFDVSTAPEFRRRGLSRLCMDALLVWFRDETPVAVVELHASKDGAPLYTAMGFVAPRHPALAIRIQR